MNKKDDKKDHKKDPIVLDWDYQEEFYNDGNQNDKETPSLDDFMNEEEKSEISSTLPEYDAQSIKLQQTVQDVRNIKMQYAKGKSVQEIADELALDPDYVILVMITLQGYAQDDDIAIAHMVMLG